MLWAAETHEHDHDLKRTILLHSDPRPITIHQAESEINMKFSSTPIFILALALLILHVQATGSCTSYRTVYHTPEPTGTTTADTHLAQITDSKGCTVTVSAASHQMPSIVLVATIISFFLI
ncbi:hypothetical protein BDZ45DRAFT_751598 [Acephala macrosclerotiorum]|nr:hypothetical protein BDZ45DRAFT_751598 [Acephala macrosclerotiorum]